MMAKTHLLFSFSLGALPLSTGTLESPDTLFLQSYFGGLALGTLFPDIDEPESFIGKRTPLLPHLIRLITPHRGLTHSFWILLFWFALAFWILDTYPPLGIFALAFAMGNLFHVLGDAMTVSGIRLFLWPISSYRLTLLPDSMRFSVGSLREYGWFVCFAIIAGIQSIALLQIFLGYHYDLLKIYIYFL